MRIPFSNGEFFPMLENCDFLMQKQKTDEKSPDRGRSRVEISLIEDEKGMIAG